MKYLLLIAGLIYGWSDAYATNTWWLNVPGYIDIVENKDRPALSLPTSSYETCRKAMINYIENHFVYYIGCDIEPLPSTIKTRSN